MSPTWPNCWLQCFLALFKSLMRAYLVLLHQSSFLSCYKTLCMILCGCRRLGAIVCGRVCVYAILDKMVGFREHKKLVGLNGIGFGAVQRQYRFVKRVSNCRECRLNIWFLEIVGHLGYHIGWDFFVNCLCVPKYILALYYELGFGH